VELHTFTGGTVLSKVALTPSANPVVVGCLNVTLYDGQTKEMLAFYKIEKNGEKSGLGFKTGEVGFDATKGYIDEMMKDERQ